MYTLADAINPETGWGLAGETWRVMESLGLLGGVTWFNLGDQDLATHCYRTQRLSEGAPLGTVTAELAERFGVGVRLVPVTDDPLRTRLAARGRRRGRLPGVLREAPPRRGRATRCGSTAPRTPVPGPGVLEAIAEASTVVVCPSNPVVSIDPLLAVPGRPRGARRPAGPDRGRLPHRGRRRAQGSGGPPAGRDGLRVLGGRRRPLVRPLGVARW